MHRPTLGIAALTLLVVGLVLTFWRELDAGGSQFQAACLRVGVVLSVVWLAHPQLKHLPPWMIPGVLSLLIIVAVRPRYAPILVVALLIMAIVKPRKKSTARSPVSGNRRH